MKLYMSVTKDKLELPVYVALTLTELAEHYDITVENLLVYISKGDGRHCGRDGYVKFVRVDIGDDNELLEEQKEAKRAVRKPRTHSPNGKRVIIIDTLTGEKYIFPSGAKAGEFIGVNKWCINQRVSKLKKNEFRYKHYIVKVGN